MITLLLPGEVVPKARPRITRNGSYMPQRYRCWKTLAASRLKSQYQGGPIAGAAVSITLTGKHPRRGDADNIGGSILDALVQAGILRNDNLMCVPALSVRLDYGSQTPIVQIEIVPKSDAQRSGKALDRKME